MASLHAQGEGRCVAGHGRLICELRSVLQNIFSDVCYKLSDDGALGPLADEIIVGGRVFFYGIILGEDFMNSKQKLTTAKKFVWYAPRLVYSHALS